MKRLFDKIVWLFKRSGGDTPLWVILVLLLIISIPIGYTSIVSFAYQELGGETTGYLMGRLLYAGAGLTAAWVVHR